MNEEENFNNDELIRHYSNLLKAFKHVISLLEKNKDVSKILQRGVKLEALRTLYQQMVKISVFIPQSCLAVKDKKTHGQDFEDPL